jgi:hypothetical protein
VKYALLLLLSACALPMEEHGGAAPRPEPSDLTFMGAGAAINTTGILLKAPQWTRVVADALAVIILRFPKWGGRYEGVALTLPMGAFVPEWTNTLIHGLKHPSHPACYKYVGPDTVVTTPVALQPIKGHRWGNECLSWEEERILRHEN